MKMTCADQGDNAATADSAHLSNYVLRDRGNRMVSRGAVSRGTACGRRSALFAQQKSEHGIGINLRLLDVGDMRGLERGDAGAGNVLFDELVAFERRRRVVP